MTGAKLQLYSIGKENSYLTNNPQISFFKQVYMRYSNFAMQTINLQFENIGNLSFTDTTKIKLKLDKNGDLIHKNVLEINIPAIYSTNDKLSEFHFHWANNIADIIVKNARIIIGGHVIEEYDTEYMYIYNKLSYSVDKQLQLDKLMCKDKLKYNPQRYSFPANSADVNNMLPSYEEQTIFIPLPFWFHRNIGASLPIVNLLYHDAILEIELRPLSQLINYHKEINTLTNTSNPPNLFKHTQIKSVENLQKDKVLAIFKNKTWNINPILNAEYIFLDEELRKTFNKNTLQYVVEPITKVIIQNKHGHLDLRDEPTNSMPHHPCKEIFVVPRRNDVKNTNNWLNFTNWDNYLDTSKYLDHQNYYLELARNYTNNIILNNKDGIINNIAVNSSQPIYQDTHIAVIVRKNVITTTITGVITGFTIDDKVNKYHTTIDEIRILDSIGQMRNFIRGEFNLDLNNGVINRVDVNNSQFIYQDTDTAVIVRKNVITPTITGVITGFTIIDRVNEYDTANDEIRILDSNGQMRNFIQGEFTLDLNSDGTITSTDVVNSQFIYQDTDTAVIVRKNVIELIIDGSGSNNKIIGFTVINQDSNYDSNNDELIILDSNNKIISRINEFSINLINLIKKYSEFRDNTTISINSSTYTIQAADKITDTDITNLLNIWKYRDFEDIPSINANNYSHFTTNIIQNISIDFDETNRVHKKDYLFFNKLQPYMHHNNYLEGICSYSFSIHPDKYQPSGSCNLGNIKNIRFDIDLKEINTELSNTEKYKYDVLIYMKYYNVLEIKSGMADLLFRI